MTCERMRYRRIGRRGLAAAAAVLVLSVLVGCSGSSGPPASGDLDSLSAPATDIYIAPVQQGGDGFQIGAVSPLVQRPGYDNQPAFTPDATSLVFTSLNDGQADLYRVTVGTYDVTRITGTPESEYSPTPRPDQRISLVRVEEDGRQRLWQYSAFGRPIAPILPNADSVGYHAWIDRTRVALFRVASPPELVVADVTTGVDTVVVERIGRSLQPVPGRSAVSYIRVAPDSSTAVHVVGRNDSLSTTRLVSTPGTGQGIDHAWTPDGTLLMVDEQVLYAWRPGRTTWRRVRNLAPLEVTRLAVSPDGAQLALVAREDSAPPS
jgi:hypothetical protein